MAFDLDRRVIRLEGIMNNFQEDLGIVDQNFATFSTQVHDILRPQQLRDTERGSLNKLKAQVAAVQSSQFWLTRQLKSVKSNEPCRTGTPSASSMAMDIVNNQLLTDLQKHVRELQDAKSNLVDALAIHLNLPRRLDALEVAMAVAAETTRRSREENRLLRENVQSLETIVLALKRDVTELRNGNSSASSSAPTKRKLPPTFHLL